MKGVVHSEDDGRGDGVPARTYTGSPGFHIGMGSERRGTPLRKGSPKICSPKDPAVEERTILSLEGYTTLGFMTTQSEGCKVRIFPLLRYVEEALRRAEYDADENGMIIGKVPEAPGFFAEGATRKEAEENLRDVIEGNILLALQLGFDIPILPGIQIRYVETGT